ncbi:MAG TPA: addiction module toxin RelE [Candidatus Nanoarchaeia archaeon]|nr:addiction module toxin RelE [Candidatus Nanoarchaeia archaeon]
MYSAEVSKKLTKILSKLLKRDKIRYEASLKKIQEICSSPDVNHYKNLSHGMKQFKRVHIDSHFVLVFHIDESKKLIKFEDLQHHDFIYRR